MSTFRNVVFDAPAQTRALTANPVSSWLSNRTLSNVRLAAQTLITLLAPNSLPHSSALPCRIVVVLLAPIIHVCDALLPVTICGPYVPAVTRIVSPAVAASHAVSNVEQAAPSE
jgi:hypothetical protein